LVELKKNPIPKRCSRARWELIETMLCEQFRRSLRIMPAINVDGKVGGDFVGGRAMTRSSRYVWKRFDTRGRLDVVTAGG
jgi:hypothetical protein